MSNIVHVVSGAVHVKEYAGVVQVKGYTEGFKVWDPVVRTLRIEELH